MFCLLLTEDPPLPEIQETDQTRKQQYIKTVGPAGLVPGRKNGERIAVDSRLIAKITLRLYLKRIGPGREIRILLLRFLGPGRPFPVKPLQTVAIHDAVLRGI